MSLLNRFVVTALAAATIVGVPSAAHAIPNFTLSPGSVNAGYVLVGTDKTVEVTITNQATNPNPTAFDTYIDDEVPPQNKLGFRISQNCGIPPQPKDYPANSSCKLFVQFSPKHTGPVSGAYTFTLHWTFLNPANNAPIDTEKTFTVPLAGAGSVLCGGLLSTVNGTNGVDAIVGTNGNDVIATEGGNDLVDGAGGNDVICGGGGNDLLRGAAGNDKLLGQDGNDKLKGGPGTDKCKGGPGTDRARKCERVRTVP